ncbi:MAG: hypothetical protein ACI8R4_001957 [Paracoccaceae bacterium]|jgi:hypothetical protein
MGLKSRLGKLERHRSIFDADLTKLSDAELAAGRRKCIEQLGIDWDSFQDDPTGAIEKTFEGVEDDEGIIAGLLGALGEADTKWLRGECSSVTVDGWPD